MVDGNKPQQAVSAWRRWLRRLGVEIYPGEGATSGLLFTAFFLCLTFHYVGKTVRQATFVDTLGAARLPLVYLLVAIVSIPVLQVYGRAADRLDSRQLVARTCWIVAGSLVLFWWLFQFSWNWIPVTFYVWISIAIALTLSQLWSFANHVLNPRQAKRLYGFIGAGALAGSVVGGQLARGATVLTEPRYSLLVAALLLSGVIAVVGRVKKVGNAREKPAPEQLQRSRGGFAAVRQSRLLQLIAALMLVSIMVSQVVDLQFSWAVESATEGLANRTVYFGNFYSVMGLAAFLFQMVMTTRIHRSLGVGFAVRVLPAAVGTGTVLLFVTAALFPGVLILAALLLKATENGIRYSLDDSSRELLFLPVSAAKRLKAKAFIDVVVKRGAKGLAALLLLPVTFGILSPLDAGWITLTLVGIWLLITVATRREYVRSFRTGMKRKAVDGASPINLADITTLEILVQSLGSADPRQVMHSLDLLSFHGRGHLVPPVLVCHDDAEVRRKTLQILAEQGRNDAAPLVERRLGDEDPDVRAEAIRVLAELRHQDACQMMLPRLREPDSGVRAAAITCLQNHGNDEMRELAGRALTDMLTDESCHARVEGVRVIGSISCPQFGERLVQLLYDPDLSVVRAAIDAIRRRCARQGPNPIYLPSLISLLQDRRLKHEAREALVTYGESAVPALVLFLKDDEESTWVRRAIPKTIAQIGSPAAAKGLFDSLAEQVDPYLRLKLIEALGSFARDRSGTGDSRQIRNEISKEIKSYLSILRDLQVLDRSAAVLADRGSVRLADDLDQPDLLTRLLVERAEGCRRNIFGLLSLVFGRGHIWDAYGALVGRVAERRAHALEYLDHTLSGAEFREIFETIGDDPLEAKIGRFNKRSGGGEDSMVEVLRRYTDLGPDQDADASFLSVAALYMVHTHRVEDLYDHVRRTRAHSESAFVRETAAWVNRRLIVAGYERSPAE